MKKQEILDLIAQAKTEITEDSVDYISRKVREAAEAASELTSKSEREHYGRMVKAQNEYQQKQVEEINKTYGMLIDRALKVAHQYREEMLTTRWPSHQLKDEKLRNQREAIRLLEEKLSLMKTWRGIFRTAGQRLGLCR